MESSTFICDVCQNYFAIRQEEFWDIINAELLRSDVALSSRQIQSFRAWSSWELRKVEGKEAQLAIIPILS